MTRAHRRLLIAATAILLVGSLVVVPLVLIGPRDLWRMLRYDQRQEGSLKVGDKAPDGVLKELQDGKSVSLQENIGDRPLVLIFGSYT